MLQYPWGKEYGVVYISQRSTHDSVSKEHINKDFSFKIFTHHGCERKPPIHSYQEVYEKAQNKLCHESGYKNLHNYFL